MDAKLHSARSSRIPLRYNPPSDAETTLGGCIAKSLLLLGPLLEAADLTVDCILGPDTTIICEEKLGRRRGAGQAGEAQVKVAPFACKVQQSIASYKMSRGDKRRRAKTFHGKLVNELRV